MKWQNVSDIQKCYWFNTICRAQIAAETSDKMMYRNTKQNVADIPYYVVVKLLADIFPFSDVNCQYVNVEKVANALTIA